MRTNVIVGVVGLALAVVLRLGPPELLVPVYMFAGMVIGQPVAESARLRASRLQAAFLGTVVGLAVGALLPLAIEGLVDSLDALSTFLLRASVVPPQAVLLAGALLGLAGRLRGPSDARGRP